MNKQKVITFLTLFFCLFCSHSLALNSEMPIDKLINLSGLTKQVNEFPGLMKTGMIQAKQQGAAIPDDLFNELLKSVDTSILPIEILENISSSLKESISDDEIKTLLEWYESDLGRSITVAEEKASTPEAYQLMISEAKTLLAHSKRVETAKRLDKLIGATEMVMNLQKICGIAVYSAIMKAVSPDQPLNIDKYKSQMLSIEPKMRANIEQLAIISFVYSYKTFEDKSLDKYETFLNKLTTVKFNNAVIESLKSGFEASITKWSFKVGEIFKNKVNNANAADAKSRAAD